MLTPMIQPVPCSLSSESTLPVALKSRSIETPDFPEALSFLIDADCLVEVSSFSDLLRSVEIEALVESVELEVEELEVEAPIEVD